jgi:hypothetical protein
LEMFQDLQIGQESYNLSKDIYQYILLLNRMQKRG